MSFASSGKPSLIAYMGLTKHHPKNTLGALRAAAQIGVKHIMIDVQACFTGELVLCDTLTVLTDNGPMFIQTMSLSELSMLDMGGGQRILTLEDVFIFMRDDIAITIRVIGRHSLPAVINFFSNPYPKRSAPLWLAGSDQLLLHSLSNRLPSFNIVAVLAGIPLVEMGVLKQHGIRAVVLPPEEINGAIVHSLKLENMQLWACDVDNFALYQRCVSFGVKNIISDHPVFIDEYEAKLLPPRIPN